MKEKTLGEHMAIIKDFAEKFGLTFERWGTIGLGRKCVGFTKNNYFISYNPINTHNPERDDFMEFVKYLYDERFFELAPQNADSKSNCLAIMGWGIDSIIELSIWIDKLNELNVSIEKYSNFCNTDFYALRLNN